MIGESCHQQAPASSKAEQSRAEQSSQEPERQPQQQPQRQGTPRQARCGSGIHARNRRLHGLAWPEGKGTTRRREEERGKEHGCSPYQPNLQATLRLPRNSPPAKAKNFRALGIVINIYFSAGYQKKTLVAAKSDFARLLRAITTPVRGGYGNVFQRP